MLTLAQLALNSPLFILFCIPFLPPLNSKMVNWLNQYNTKSNCQWNIPLHWYFSKRSSKAGAISIRLLSRLLLSCLSQDPYGVGRAYAWRRSWLLLISHDWTRFISFCGNHFPSCSQVVSQWPYCEVEKGNHILILPGVCMFFFRGFLLKIPGKTKKVIILHSEPKKWVFIE